jgi:TPR repeat protein
LLRAAEAGDAGSQYNLGILCDNGLDDNRPSGIRTFWQSMFWLSWLG